MDTQVTCTNIYEAALALLAEPDEERCADYAERAPYILASLLSEAGAADAMWREAHNLPAQPSFNSVYVGLAEQFPLCDRFVAPSAAYLAAFLILDENEALSDKLYEKYCDGMSSICSELPAIKKSITDIYGF